MEMYSQVQLTLKKFTLYTNLMDNAIKVFPMFLERK